MHLTRKFHPNGDSYCSECKKERHRIFLKNPKNKQLISKYGKASVLKKRYGLSLFDHNEMKIKQNFLCFICKESESGIDKRTGKLRELAIDHCHRTGKIRSLLCRICNTVIGAINEDISMAKKIISYLKINRFD